MRFLVDAQLPVALARGLTTSGHDAAHVADIGLGDAPDSEIWRYAISKSLIIISKDEDFAQRKTLSRSGPTIVWVRKGNTRKQDLLAWFDAILPQLIEALARGEELVELI